MSEFSRSRNQAKRCLGVSWSVPRGVSLSLSRTAISPSSRGSAPSAGACRTRSAARWQISCRSTPGSSSIRSRFLVALVMWIRSRWTVAAHLVLLGLLLGGLDHIDPLAPGCLDHGLGNLGVDLLPTVIGLGKDRYLKCFSGLMVKRQGQQTDNPERVEIRVPPRVSGRLVGDAVLLQYSSDTVDIRGLTAR